jgi:hypothetical protein
LLRKNFSKSQCYIPFPNYLKKKRGGLKKYIKTKENFIYMQNKIYDSIIVGAGISGIGCAHKLLENKYGDFKIISPTIGGRILESDSSTVEYGAYYIMDIYHNTASFVKKGRKIHPTKMMFHNKNQSYKVFNKKLYTHFSQLIRLIFILRKFKKHYEKFKKRCLFESQAKCLKSDKYLWELYNKNAKDFVIEKKVKDIVYDYMAEVLHGTAFTPIENLNAFTFLHFSLPLIVPVHEFIFRKKEVENFLKNHHINDEVIKIKKNKDNYEITTKSKDKFYAKNLVIATPPHISKKLLNHKQKLRGSVDAHMFHLIGEIRDEWNDVENNLFSDKSRMLAIAHQRDNSYLFYSVDKNPNFNKYFYHYEILKHKYWNPAFSIEGNHLVDFIQGENLFLIGDNNLCGIEPTYIYGMYCANKILGKTKD